MGLLWLLVALAGQAAALRLINAGPGLHYQHYTPFGRAWAEQPFALAIVAVQAALVLAGAFANRQLFRSWLSKRARPVSIAAAVAFISIAGATLSRSVPAYVQELIFAALVQAVNLANVILAAASLPESWVARLYKRWERSSNRLIVAGALWVALVSAFLNVVSYERHPHVADEVVYIAHARYLAAGMLTMPAPPVREAFDMDLMTYDAGRWYCPVPPLWPVVLAGGVLAGIPWLVNPVLGGIGVLLAFLFLRELYELHTARLAALLLCASPWYLFLSMSFMPHCLTLDLALAAGIAVRRAAQSPHRPWGPLAGVAVGALSLVRPLDAAIVAALIGLWVLGWRRLRFPAVAGMAVCCAAVAAAALPYNAYLTGNPLLPPIQAYTDRYYAPGSNSLGFGANRGLGWPLDPYPGHGLRDVAVNANLNLTTLNTELFGWSSGSLVFLAVLLFAARLEGRDRFMLASILATIGAYSLYWFSGGPDFGPRYWFLVIVPCVVLTARGISHLRSTRALTAALVMIALAMLIFVPWRAADKYRNYLGMRADIRDLAARHGFGRSLVLVRGERFPDYMSAAVYNPVDLRQGTVYAWDRNPEVRRKVAAAYSDRPVWVVNGPSLTGAGYAVAVGPLSTNSLP